MTEPAPHPTRYAHGNRLQLAAEMVGVEALVPLTEFERQGLVIGVRLLTSSCLRRRLDLEGDDLPSRRASLGACPALDESHDRLVHVERRRQVSRVHAKALTLEAHHDVTVSRQTAIVDASQPQHAKSNEELDGIGWHSRARRVELERELRRIASPREDGRQRAKHFTGPATNVPSSFDHTNVDTSMSFSVMRMLLTDDGLPPRERLLIVPDVEMIVPRFVCSM